MTITDLGLAPILRNTPIAGLSIIGTTIACWFFFFSGAGTGMDVWKMSVMGFPPKTDPIGIMVNPSNASALSMVFMWWTMMLAMMMPGAFKHLPTQPKENITASANLLQFWVSYAVIWLAFSMAATGAQYLLINIGLVHGMKMWSNNIWFSATMLTIAGLYQFTQVKARSLLICHAVPSDGTPISNGAIYGLNCLISSSPMALLLFIGGVMNIYWIMLLTAVLTLEKTIQTQKPFSIAVGTASMGAAAAILIF